MSLAQLTETFAIGAPTPKLKMTTNILTTFRFTVMCWANHTGTGADAYQDLFGVTDLNDVCAMSLHTPGASRLFSLGDLNSDHDGITVIGNNEWHHYCMTVDDVSGTGTTCYGFVDGRPEIGPVSLINPIIPTFCSIWNTRASDSDPGGVFVGRACAFKIWDNLALDRTAVLQEMWYYMPQNMAGLYAFSPMSTVDYRTNVFLGRAGQDWTTQSALWTTGPDPPGVIWDNPKKYRRPSTWLRPASRGSGFFFGG